MSSLLFGLAVAALIFVLLVLLLAFLPAILAKVLDPRNSKVIREHCEQLRFSEINVKAWPNHYGASFRKKGRACYAKCVVRGGTVRWKGTPPEAL